MLDPSINDAAHAEKPGLFQHQPPSQIPDNSFFFGDAKEALFEVPKEATLIILAHCLTCLSEMLTFFICIFFLKQWLQFDLFRGLPGAPEAAIFNAAATKKPHPSLKSQRFWKRKNRSRSPSRSVGRSETEEIFTSSESEDHDNDSDDISVDDISSDTEDELLNEDNDEVEAVLEEDKEEPLVVTDVTNVSESVEDSFHSEIDEDELIAVSDVESLDSELSWFEQYYIRER